MPLDTPLYALTLLRPDGRRWNELRRVNGSISTQPAADGSSLFCIGNTVVVGRVAGPGEGKGQRDNANAIVDVEITIAPFAQADRRRRTKGDKRVHELQAIIASAFQTHLFTHLYPRSTVSINLHILSLDGSLLAACLNACTLALIDAGVPMPSYLAAVTSGIIPSNAESGKSTANEPVLDLSGQEELEIPFLTIATVTGTNGQEDKVSILFMESRCQISGETGNNIESMIAVGIDGAKRIRGILDDVVRDQGKRTLRGRHGH